MGGKKLVVPDYKTYKVDRWTPELLNVQQKLAAKGLKDPWLRNEVWRYDERMWNTPTQRLKIAAKRGLIPGIALAIITTAISNYYDSHSPHHTPWYASRTGDEHGGHH